MEHQQEEFDADGVLREYVSDDHDELAPEDEFLVQCTAIEITRIDEEMSRVHAEMARWHARYSDAYRALLYAELEHKRERARLFLIHNETPGTNGKAPSVEVVKSRVHADPEYMATYTKLIDAQIEHERMQGICKVVKVKADMCIGLNNRSNAELRANPALASAVT
jgi:hypothetical protein